MLVDTHRFDVRATADAQIMHRKRFTHALLDGKRLVKKSQVHTCQHQTRVATSMARVVGVSAPWKSLIPQEQVYCHRFKYFCCIHRRFVIHVAWFHTFRCRCYCLSQNFKQSKFHKVKTPESGATSRESQRSVESGLVEFLVIYAVFIFLHRLNCF